MERCSIRRDTEVGNLPAGCSHETRQGRLAAVAADVVTLVIDIGQRSRLPINHYVLVNPVVVQKTAIRASRTVIAGYHTELVHTECGGACSPGIRKHRYGAARAPEEAA